MKFFIDTEFIESGASRPIELLSVGIICEDGRTFYAVDSGAVLANANDWVQENVLPHLGEPRISRDQIRRGIQKFVGDVTPEFWGYYADYDWVVFCQIFGSMMDLPKGWPMYCRDLKQLCDSLGNPELPKQDSTEHNALNDAKWTTTTYELLARHFPVGEGSEVETIRKEMLARFSDKLSMEEIASVAYTIASMSAGQAIRFDLLNNVAPVASGEQEDGPLVASCQRMSTAHVCPRDCSGFLAYSGMERPPMMPHSSAAPSDSVEKPKPARAHECPSCGSDLPSRRGSAYDLPNRRLVECGHAFHVYPAPSGRETTEKGGAH